MNKQLNSHNFEQVYKDLNVNLNTLGCIMLDLDPLDFKFGYDDQFYYSNDKSMFWINGWVADTTPHVTLLYGLLESGKKNKVQVDRVLKGWETKEVEVESIGYFDSPIKTEPYYCIVAHIKVNDELLEGHQRLEFLPHINTFAGYKPHFTIAYVVKEEKIRDEMIKNISKKLVGKKLKIRGINYGK